jgi:hypothetical protein
MIRLETGMSGNLSGVALLSERPKRRYNSHIRALPARFEHMTQIVLDPRGVDNA